MCRFGMAQDAYHQELLSQLDQEYGLQNPTYVFYTSEQEIADGMYIYGSAGVERAMVAESNFSVQQTYTVHAVGNNAWDSGAGMRSRQVVSQGDVILVTFWARRMGDQSEVTFFAEDGVTFEKELDFRMNFTQDWVRYFGAFKAQKDYPVDGLVIGFHLASQVQAFALGGFTALNFGEIDLDSVPSSFSPDKYGGYEQDALWRLDAEQRINEIRKHDLIILVQDEQGRPIPNANISIDMLQHEFGFGSALVACRFPGNRCEDPAYLNKINDLDGRGHGFNTAVIENALKWDGWEEEWIGTPAQTIAAITWLTNRDIPVRGHTLIWPGWNHMPDDMMANQNDLSYLRMRIDDRLVEMLAHPSLSNLISEWDVLNEITQVRDLERAFAKDPNLTTGREIYQEIMEKARSLHPDFSAYVNDYVVLSGGGAGTSVVNRYKSYLDELILADADFDGIGFQCHIGSQPTSIWKVKEVLDDFSNKYNKQIKITEFDINPSVDPQTQAKYLEDFLTIIYSHPAVEAFLMWGFWDGNHWKGNAPIFNLDWSLKPSGQAFIDKVFGEWWTNENGVTNASGIYSARAFKGQHLVKVEVDGSVEELSISTDIDTVHFEVATTSTPHYQAREPLMIYPNPASRKIVIDGPEQGAIVQLKLHDVHGKVIMEMPNFRVGNSLSLDLATGIYFLKLGQGGIYQTNRFIVLAED